MATQPAILNTARLNNFRLAYQPAELAAIRNNTVRIVLAGQDAQTATATTRVLREGFTIREVINDLPNTAQLTCRGVAPRVGQSLRILVNSNTPIVLFTGELQTVGRSYLGRSRLGGPNELVYPCQAIDDSARASRKKPLGVWTNASASTVAVWLMNTYAPGFSTAGVVAGLPTVSVNFDGSEGGVKGCLTLLAKLIGGYWFIEDLTLYLFLTAPGIPPDPITDTPKRFLDDPPISAVVDKSQVRTRVYGKGAAAAITGDVGAGQTILPISSAVNFSPSGGKAIAAVTPDGGASQVLAYTGVQVGGGGSLVGPGATPTTAPTLSLAAGTGIETGPHGYAVTFVTASGQSLPGPVGSITVGLLAPPATALTPGSPTSGGAVDVGTHDYAVTFVTGSGETTPGVNVSAPVTVELAGHFIAAPTTAPLAFHPGDYGPHHTSWNVGDKIKYCVTFTNAQGQTTAGPFSNTLTGVASEFGGVQTIDLSGLPVCSDPTALNKRVYRYVNNVCQGSFSVANSANVSIQDGGPLTAGNPPTSNTAFVPSGTSYQTIPLTAIPLGASLVTARKLYRRFNGTGTFKLVTTIADNTTTSYSDTAANAALGAAAPSTNTATANQVLVTIPVGPTGVTQRWIYRTAVNGSVLGGVGAIADNTTNYFLDTMPDASRGAAPPVVDTSGLQQPAGQVVAGSSTMIVANAAAFQDNGGWAVIGNGEQVIRYTGKTATALTGIPALGPGAIQTTVAYNSNASASPALVGVSGLTLAIARGSQIHVWVQRDDVAAQAYMQSLDGHGDGVYENIFVDARRVDASLNDVCDAELALFSRPLVTARYATRDQKTKSGKTVAINLASPPIDEDLTIQDVTIDQFDLTPAVGPRFTVTASNVRQTLEAILRQLMRKSEA